MNDVTHGDASGEEADPRLIKGLAIAQYACQYMQTCRVFLEGKCQSIDRALHVFDEEEELLDISISKLG